MIASKPILQPPAPHSRHKALALSPADCAAQLRAALAWRPGEWREVRVIGRNAPRKAVVSSPEEVASAIEGLEYGVGVFITVNPIANGADTAAKVGKNLVTAVRGTATSDAAIERRTRFVIDIDPVRPTDTSATPEQLGEARALATTLSEALSLEGWPRPTMVTSGNGMHLYYSVDLEACSELPVRALQGLSARFGTTTVKVDTTVGNAARIMRVPGTWTAKGADRGLHRVALLETTGDDQPVTSGQLEAAGSPALATEEIPPDANASSISFDIDGWLQRHGVKHRGKEAWPGAGAGAHRWVLDTCAFNPTHDKGEAVITQQATGAVGYRCLHDSCSGHGWRDFRRVVEMAVTSRSPLPPLRAPYPTDALPPLVRDIVATQVGVMRVDEAAVAVPILTAMLGVVGNSVLVEPWPTWTETMVAWTGLIAPSGQMKSATLGITERALEDLEKSLPRPDPDGEPERLVVNDTTVEALGDVAAKNPRGLILFRDELAAHIRAIGQYKKTPGADEAFWLSATEGKRHAVDRRSTGSTIVSRLLVSVLGGIQPTVLKDVMSERKLCESGFTARFWFIWAPRRFIKIEQPNSSQLELLLRDRARMRLCLESLRRIPTPDGNPITLRLHQDAAERLRDFANQQEEIAFGLPDSSVERSCRQKSRGWAARLAGLIALIRCYEELGPLQDGDPTLPDYLNESVRLEDIEAAIRLTEWQLGENSRVHRNLRLDDLDLILEYQNELAREAMDPATGAVTVRGYQRKHGVSNDEAEKVLSGLVKADLWGLRHPKPGPKGGRPTSEYFPLGDSSLA